MRCEWEWRLSLPAAAWAATFPSGYGGCEAHGERNPLPAWVLKWPKLPLPLPCFRCMVWVRINICCVNPWVWVLLLQLSLTDTVTDIQVCQGKYMSNHPQSNLIESHFWIFWGIYRRCWMGYFGWLESLCWHEINLVLALFLSLIMLCISVVSTVTFPFSYLILLVWVLSLFVFMTLAIGLSILFMFSKNQLLLLLIFAIALFVSLSFLSALIFMISFLYELWVLFALLL